MAQQTVTETVFAYLVRRTDVMVTYRGSRGEHKDLFELEVNYWPDPEAWEPIAAKCLLTLDKAEAESLHYALGNHLAVLKRVENRDETPQKRRSR